MQSVVMAPAPRLFYSFLNPTPHPHPRGKMWLSWNLLCSLGCQLLFYMDKGQLKMVRRPKPALLAPAATTSNFSASLDFILFSVTDKSCFNSKVPGRGLQDIVRQSSPGPAPGQGAVV